MHEPPRTDPPRDPPGGARPPERPGDPTGEAAARWERAQALFHEALERPAGEREAFLLGASGDEPGVLEQVRAMLVADASGHALLDGGLAAAAGGVLEANAGALPTHAFGPYRVTGVLGEGGMGVVYRGWREDLSSEAAVKVLRDATLSPARRERFAFEQRSLAQLSHAAIARLFDAGTLPDGTPWFAMELVDGLTITDHCRERGLGVEARLRLFRDVCEAVQHAHAHAILHRDLKPSNILVRADGQLKLLDFGIAKPLESAPDAAGATRTGLRLMTPAYAAPEQLRGGVLGVHTDVYSLGVVLYELLAGRLPFDLDGRSPSEAAEVLTRQAPRRPSARTTAESGAPPTRGPGRSAWNDLDVLCLTAMHADPARRYGTVEALVRDLDRYLADEPLEARGDSFRYRAGKFVRRNARVVTAASLGLALLVTVVAFYTLRLSAARTLAQAETARTQRIQRFMTQMFMGGEDAAGPSETLRVVTLLGRGAEQAQSLSNEPRVHAELERTLGTLYLGLGRFDLADSLLEAALARTEALRPPAHADVARSLAALARLRADEERFDEAESAARRATELASRRLPAGHPVRAEATAALGYALLNRGAHQEAVPVLREALRMVSAGGVTAEMAGATSMLANAHFYLGEWSTSDSLYRRSVKMSLELYGPRHPDVANDLVNMGSIQFQIGRPARAESLYREAYGITRGWYGAGHPLTASCLTKLARAIILQDRPDEAVALLRQALAIQQRAYGERHHQVAGTLNELGNVALSWERYAEAESCFTQVADMYRGIYGPHSTSLAVALSNLGSVYLDTREHRRAEDCFRRALVAYEGAVPAGHVEVGISRIKLGRSLLRQERYAEGERETLAGYEILSSQTEPQTSFLRAARKDLVAGYEALGRPADAARFRAELADTAAAR